MSESNSSLLRTVLGSGSLLLVGLTIQLLLNFGSRLVLARLLGRVDYGAVSLGVTLLLTLSIVSLLGTDNGVGRYLPRYDATSKRGAVLRSGLELTLPIAVMLSLSAALLSPVVAKYAFGDPSVGPVLRVFSLGVPFLVILKFVIGSIRGMKQTLPRVYLESFGIPILRFLFVISALLAGASVVGVSLAYVAGYVVVAIAALWFLLVKTPIRQAERGTELRREILSFSAPLMVVATVNIFFSNVDTFLLGYFTTTGDVGVYNAIYPLASLLTITLTAFGFIFMPAVSEYEAENKISGLRHAYQTLSKWVFALTLPLFLLFVTYPERVIRLTFGSGYTDGGLALSVLVVGFFFHAVGGPAGNILTASGRTRFIMLTNLIVLSVNVVLNVILIPQYSIVGAAAATVAGYVLMNGLYISLLYREFGLHPFSRDFLRVTAVGALTWIGFTIVIWGLQPRLICFVSLYFGFLLVFVLSTLAVINVEPEIYSFISDVEDQTGLDMSLIRRLLNYLAD